MVSPHKGVLSNENHNNRNTKPDLILSFPMEKNLLPES